MGVRYSDLRFSAVNRNSALQSSIFPAKDGDGDDDSYHAARQREFNGKRGVCMSESKSVYIGVCKVVYVS